MTWDISSDGFYDEPFFGKFANRTEKRKLAYQLHPAKLLSYGHWRKIWNNLLCLHPRLMHPKSLKQFANMNTDGALGSRAVFSVNLSWAGRMDFPRPRVGNCA